jgi:adenylate cyclase
LNRPELLSYRLKSIGKAIVIGAVAGGFVGYSTSFLDEINPIGPTLRGLLIAGFIVAHIGIFEEFFYNSKLRKTSYLTLLISRTIFHSIAILFWLVLINAISLAIETNLSFSEAINFYLFEASFDRDAIMIVIGATVMISLLQIKRLHTKGTLIKFILGVYHRPKEVERIFLFLDLKSSTAIAERLGNIVYSNFLIDYFYDITDAILMAKAEIYQYVGDEIILTWPLNKGIKNANCINCFFDIRNSIELKKSKYIEQYGVHPEFKAGLHGGNVVVTWIGDLKKEIVYHGDVLNTTARLETECNKHNQILLTSEYILKNIDLPEHLEASLIDEMQLRGKEEKTKVYGLNTIKKVNL